MNQVSKRYISENVPSNKISISFYLLFFVTALISNSNFQIINCEDFGDSLEYNKYQRANLKLIESSLESELEELELLKTDFDQGRYEQAHGSRTPPLEAQSELTSSSGPPKNEIGPSMFQRINYLGKQDGDNIDIIPTKVVTDSLSYNRLNDGRLQLHSPIFELHKSISPNDLQDRMQNDFSPAQSLSNALDLVDSGSGVGPSETSSAIDDSSSSEYDPNTATPSSTPIDAQNYDGSSTDMYDPVYNQAPQLKRRLPKLEITAGRVWKYLIPTDTFLDEDGDLRQLKSSIKKKDPLGTNNTGSDDYGINYFTWYQYDQNSQLIYALPTENDVGRHELVLQVSDKYGAMSEEKLELYVKQHQSVRALSHQFVMTNVFWDRQRFASIVDTMGELIKRLSTRLYQDQPFKNSIIQYYTIHGQDFNKSMLEESNDVTPAQNRNNVPLSFTIAWSNISIPIYPCNSTVIENLSQFLVDTQNLKFDWSLGRTSFAPSISLLKALEPEYRPTALNIRLLGVCESAEPVSGSIPTIDSNDFYLRVRIKIGKLNWRLGEPIEYQIPAETFEASKGAYTTRDFQLTIHDIDGLPLDGKHGFLEFDQENQTLYGLPYDLDNHVGQRELMLTARHNVTGAKVREVFVVNIEAQDLTTVNNRAFKMSLYFVSRTGSFSARERVALSHKIVGSLRYGNSEFYHDLENLDYVVIDIKKYLFERSSRSGYEYNDIPTFFDPKSISKQVDDFDDGSDQYDSKEMLNEDLRGNRALYKFSWTNATIGHRGDCPVEVIKDSILFALEQRMSDLGYQENFVIDDSSKNDSVKFYERLRTYFDPDIDLMHIRIEPLGACFSALEVYDSGTSDIANITDQMELPGLDQDLSTPSPTISPVMPPDVNQASEEYWSIVVLIILVICLVFVIIMFFLGMLTYRKNQDKRFELQVRLAQARQNSMYLSSMLLANPGMANGIYEQSNLAKSIHAMQNDEKTLRKPAILDNEKQFFTSPRPTAVRLTGQNFQTSAVQPNSTYAIDPTVGGWRALDGLNPSPSVIANPYIDAKNQSMTLNRRTSGQNTRFVPAHHQIANLNHSQSILTVASLATPIVAIQPPGMPVVYAQVPMTNYQPYSSLQRGFSATMNNWLPQTSSSARLNSQAHAVIGQPVSQVQGPVKPPSNNGSLSRGKNSSVSEASSVIT